MRTPTREDAENVFGLIFKVGNGISLDGTEGHDLPEGFEEKVADVLDMIPKVAHLFDDAERTLVGHFEASATAWLTKRATRDAASRKPS